MGAERDPLDALLGSIADGTDPDWSALESEADAAQSSRIRALREVSRIADFSRAHQRAPALDDAPERWGDLLLLERLSGGTRSEVFRAWDPGLQREVALKLMRPGPGDEALLEEGRVAARIRHPHVVTVHGVDRRDGRIGLWMELLRGPTLEQEVRTRGAFDPDAARRIGAEVGSALVAVHTAGLLHRDVKPANIVRDAEGRHVLADFGLGMKESDAATSLARASGTPMYMAPELLLAGGASSERSDLYSLGLTLWFALAGRHPFHAESMDDLRSAASAGPRPRLREQRPTVPAALAAIVERAIDPKPEARFASVRALVDALDAWRPATGVRSAVPGRVWTLAGALAVVAAVAVALAVYGPWRARENAPLERTVTAPVQPPAQASSRYAVEASFLRRDAGGAVRLLAGDRVKPGDRLSLELRTTRPAYVYVLNEDDRGERYLLFPQARLDVRNPLPPDTSLVLPGTLGGAEHAWTVTSAGGREHFLVVVSPEPVSEIEADLGRMPTADPGRPVQYARVGRRTIEQLRGVGGMAPLPSSTARPATETPAFERFRSLAGRETDVEGVWVRQIEFENPRR
jgi:hypothetical protein